MAISVSLSGIGKDAARPITLTPGGTTAAPPADDSSVRHTTRGVEVTLKGVATSPDQDNTKESGASGSSGNSRLETMQKAIEMAKKQLELAQKQLSEAQSQGNGDNKAAIQAAQANVVAASAALMQAYSAYAEALKKGSGGSGGVSTRA
jgi:hypothetical protein